MKRENVGTEKVRGVGTGLTETKTPSRALLRVPGLIGTGACFSSILRALTAGKDDQGTSIIERIPLLFNIAYSIGQTAPSRSTARRVVLVGETGSVVGCDGRW